MSSLFFLVRFSRAPDRLPSLLSFWISKIWKRSLILLFSGGLVDLTFIKKYVIIWREDKFKNNKPGEGSLTCR